MLFESSTLPAPKSADGVLCALAKPLSSKLASSTYSKWALAAIPLGFSAACRREASVLTSVDQMPPRVIGGVRRQTARLSRSRAGDVEARFVVGEVRAERSRLWGRHRFQAAETACFI